MAAPDGFLGQPSPPVTVPDERVSIPLSTGDRVSEGGNRLLRATPPKDITPTHSDRQAVASTAEKSLQLHEELVGSLKRRLVLR